MKNVMSDTQRTMKPLVRGLYDLQKLRIQTGLRIVANWKVRNGQAPSEDEAELDAKAQKILKSLRDEYARLTDGLLTLPRDAKINASQVIADTAEFAMVRSYVSLLAEETTMTNLLQRVLETQPIYVGFLKGVKGVGPAMAGVILSEFNIHRAKYVSSLWKYAGLDVGSDGRGRSRRKEHLTPKVYTDSEGKEKETVGITFNPFLKTKLIGVLAGSFLRTGNERYVKIYTDYKHRLDSRPDLSEASKGRKHNMALRYMVKQFLADLYNEWKVAEGLEVHNQESEAKLGLKHEAA